MLKDARAKGCAATGTCAPVNTSIFNGLFGKGASSRLAQQGLAGSAFGILFILSITLLITFLILTFVHYAIYPVLSFTIADPAIITIPTATDRELSYTKEAATPNVRRDRDSKLALTSMPTCSVYTIGADVYINGGQKPIAYPNVILYRDLSDNSSTISAAPRATAEALNDTYENSNIIVWLDQATNDLNITLVTIDVGMGEELQSLSPPIQNVPLNKSFRLAIVLSDTFMEVYINGQMQRTMPIHGNLKEAGQSTNTTDFYPPVADFSTGGVKISNMSMWPRVLTSKEIRAFEAVPMSSP